jgi:hypothetical protein
VRSRPIGLRIPRPYDTEDDFIRGDGLAIGRLGMILIGAPARPPGITVRFEVLLKNGEAVFRGEGRVVAHRVHANGREGLEVRFTRLDSRSKTLVEQVLKLRKSGLLTPASTPDASGEMPAVGAATEATEDAQEAPASHPSVPRPYASPKTGHLVHPGEDPSQEAASPPVPQEASPSSEAVLDVTHHSVPASEPVVETGPGDADIDLTPEITPEPEEASPAVSPVAGEVVTFAAADPVEVERHEPPDEVLDEDPTPFAPPVTFDALEAQAVPEGAVEAIELDVAATPDIGRDSAPEISADAASALSKLRGRSGRYQTPDSSGALLDRLRARLKQS